MTVGNGTALKSSDIVHIFGAAGAPNNVLSDLTSETAAELPLTLVLILFLITPETDTVTVEHVEPKHSRLDRQRGKPKPIPYRQIRLGSMGRMHLEAVRQHHEEARGGRRAHFVRGHYFRYRDRLVWRRPHVRGGKEDGSTPEPVRAQVAM